VAIPDHLTIGKISRVKLFHHFSSPIFITGSRHIWDISLLDRENKVRWILEEAAKEEKEDFSIGKIERRRSKFDSH
jgi:hypothetical protein